MNRRIRRVGGNGEDGFTLVELLVVVVILGILSAVVVFAVRGSGDKGKAASVQTDAGILRTAQEVHCAQYGEYATMQDLKVKGLIHDLSTYNDTQPTSGGPCTGGDPAKSGFTITCTAADQAGCTVVVPPVGAGSFSAPKALNLPVGDGERSVLLTGPGCAPNCNRVVRVVNVGADPVGAYGAERYDPVADSWTPLAGFSTGQFSQFGDIVLLNGVGCGSNCGNILLHADGSGGAGWWLYNTHTNVWTQAASPTWPRNHATSLSLLGGPSCSGASPPAYCGKVLASSGESSWPQGPDYNNGAQESAELFDPSGGLGGIQGSWSLTQPLNVFRSGHLSTALPDGSVVVAGGARDGFQADRVERYVPGSGPMGDWSRLPPFTASLMEVGLRGAAGFVALNDGRLLLTVSNSAEVYDPATNTWTTAAAGCRCSRDHRATVLPSGLVLVTGGASGANSAQLYDPANNRWSDAASMRNGRSHHSATRLADGKVLATGGDTGDVPTATYEVFTP